MEAAPRANRQRIERKQWFLWIRQTWIQRKLRLLRLKWQLRVQRILWIEWFLGHQRIIRFERIIG
jgi:hypothetical protein